MNLLSPEQFHALKTLVGNTAIQISAVLGDPIERIEQFLKNITQFICDTSESLGDHTYMFLLGPSNPEAMRLDLKKAFECIRTGKQLLYVDEELRFINCVEGGVRIVDCSDRTEGEQMLGVRVERTYTHIFLCGKPLNEGDVSNPGASPPVPSKWSRPMLEFDLLIEDHKRTWVDGERGFRYWYDRINRILLVDPDGTEKLFHHSLFVWLKMFAYDALRVLGETRGMGQDKTDITIVTVGGDYVVEVKWLGKNEKGTIYRESDIDKGLAQVKIYLDNDPKLICGYLVIYDGRPIDQHKTECRYNDTLRHIRCKSPKLLFLESETPSVTAQRIATEKAS